MAVVSGVGDCVCVSMLLVAVSGWMSAWMSRSRRDWHQIARSASIYMKVFVSLRKSLEVFVSLRKSS